MERQIINTGEILKKIEKLNKKGKNEKLKNYIRNNIEMIRNKYGVKDSFLLDLYEKLIALYMEGADLNFEKSEFNNSLELYLQSYKLSEPLPGSDWSSFDKWYILRIHILKKVANNYEKLEQIDKAIEFLRLAMNLEEKAEKMSPNLKNIIDQNKKYECKYDRLYFLIGNHLIGVENYKEALKYLLKLESILNNESNFDEILKDPKSIVKINDEMFSKYLNLLKQISIAFFNVGKTDEGEKFYEKRINLKNILQNINFSKNYLGNNIISIDDNEDELMGKARSKNFKQDQAEYFEKKEIINNKNKELNLYSNMRTSEKREINKQTLDTLYGSKRDMKTNMSMNINSPHNKFKKPEEKISFKLNLKPIMGVLKTFKYPIKYKEEKSRKLSYPSLERKDTLQLLISQPGEEEENSTNLKLTDIFEKNQIKIGNKLHEYLRLKIRKNKEHLTEIKEEKYENIKIETEIRNKRGRNINQNNVIKKETLSFNNSLNKSISRNHLDITTTSKNLESINKIPRPVSNKYQIPLSSTNKKKIAIREPIKQRFTLENEIKSRNISLDSNNKLGLSTSLNKSELPIIKQNNDIDNNISKNEVQSISPVRTEGEISAKIKKRNYTTTLKKNNNDNKSNRIIDGLKKMITKLETKNTLLPPHPKNLDKKFTKHETIKIAERNSNIKQIKEQIVLEEENNFDYLDGNSHLEKNTENYHEKRVKFDDIKNKKEEYIKESIQPKLDHIHSDNKKAINIEKIDSNKNNNNIRKTVKTIDERTKLINLDQSIEIKKGNQADKDNTGDLDILKKNVLSNQDILILVKQKLINIHNNKDLIIVKNIDDQFYKIKFKYNGIIPNKKNQSIFIESRLVKMSSFNNETVYKILIQFDLDFKKFQSSLRDDFYDICLGFLNSDSQEVSVWPIILFFFEIWFENFFKKYKKSLDKYLLQVTVENKKKIYKNFMNKYEKYFERLQVLLNKYSINNRNSIYKEISPNKDSNIIIQDVTINANFKIVDYFYSILNLLDKERKLIGYALKLKDLKKEENKMKRKIYITDVINIFKNYTDFMPVRLLKVLIFDSYINAERKKSHEINEDISYLLNYSTNENLKEDFFYDG